MVLNVDFNFWVSALVTWLLDLDMSWDCFSPWLVLEVIAVMPLRKETLPEYLSSVKISIFWKYLQPIFFSFFLSLSHLAISDEG